MISPTSILIPPQIAAGPLPLGSETRIISAGAATKATRGVVGVFTDVAAANLFEGATRFRCSRWSSPMSP
jgi:hypothetical protein